MGNIAGETPLHWLLDQLAAAGRDDLITEYNARRREYALALKKANRRLDLEIQRKEESEWKRFSGER